MLLKSWFPKCNGSECCIRSTVFQPWTSRFQKASPGISAERGEDGLGHRKQNTSQAYTRRTSGTVENIESLVPPVLQCHVVVASTVGVLGVFLP